jgi:hypothetical protein
VNFVTNESPHPDHLHFVTVVDPPPPGEGENKNPAETGGVFIETTVKTIR